MEAYIYWRKGSTHVSVFICEDNNKCKVIKIESLRIIDKGGKILESSH